MFKYQIKGTIRKESFTLWVIMLHKTHLSSQWGSHFPFQICKFLSHPGSLESLPGSFGEANCKESSRQAFVQ